jgi:hypothetical protein
MATIKFNDEIISDENNNIYDLNLFINENFNYIKENPDYYEKINMISLMLSPAFFMILSGSVYWAYRQTMGIHK